MFVLRDETKKLYMEMVLGDCALDAANRNTSAFGYDRETRKLIQHALSLPFWVVDPAVLDREEFGMLYDFISQMDLIVAPESCYNKFVATYKHRIS